MSWFRRKREQPEPEVSGGQAKRAAEEGARQLRRVRNDWPKVDRASDQLAEWIDQAMRGRA